MSYTLLRSMKIQCADGRVEIRQPGAAVPEAATWQNPGIWVKRGYMKADDGKPIPPGTLGPRVPMRAVTPEDLARRAGAEPAIIEDLAKVDEVDPTDTRIVTEETLLAMSKEDLMALAKNNDVKVSPIMKKVEIAKALLDAQTGA